MRLGGALRELCAAVAAYDHERAGELVAAGADPDLALPDGTTPLLRAVEGGSPAVVKALLGEDAGTRLPEAERARLLAAARRWSEAGAEAELRRLTGARGPVEVRAVEEEWTDIEEFTLGGSTVRDGHAGVLTALERAFGIAAPLGELIDRAARYPDVCHAVWAESRAAVMVGPLVRSWQEVLAFRTHPSPGHRRFVVDYLGSRTWCVNAGSDSYEEECRVLLAWVAGEPDAGVLAALLDVFAGEVDLDTEAAALPHAGHQDPRVRREVPYCLHRLGFPLTTVSRTALHVLAGDPDAGTRCAAAGTLGHARESTTATREVLLGLLGDPEHAVRLATAGALAAWPHHRAEEVERALVSLLDEEDQLLRLEGAYGLARRDDPRTPEAYERVGPLGPEFEHDTRADELWRWKLRQRPSG
ncbi:HEAT repeat domain-containing protein [Streptomyces sp. NPDC006529]|uniref:HEAT repeat domain-containing protein n=1 Tax=Streptomyces sp. NPDC006529 TaxID=3157177 RepID=UPI0033A22953